MAVFTYVARDDAGTLVEGDVTAPTQTDAARMVRSEGKYVVRVEPKGAKKTTKSKPATKAGSTSGSQAGARAKKAGGIFGEKYRPQDLIFFTNQMAVMAETGVSLSEALEACVHEGNSPRFARALDAVIEKVQAGSEFSGALAEHPKVFPGVYVSLIKASEASGQLAPILKRISKHLENQYNVTRKIKGAITYPIVMFVFAIGVTVFLMTFVLPKFSAIYAGNEDKLPFITRGLMGFTGFLINHVLVISIVSVVSIGGTIYFLFTPAGKAFWEKFKLNVPFVGPLMHKTALARSLRTLGTMIQSGVSILDSVRLTAGVCGSKHYRLIWEGVYERLEKGQQISEALSDFREAPKAVTKMLSAGERGGRLGMVMERIADFCEAELDVSIRTLTSMIEPAIVMFLGVIVGGLVLALLLPIFSISKAMH